MMARKLDKQRCERVAGVKFSERAFSELEWLAEYCVPYADPGAEGRTAPLFMALDFHPSTTDNQKQALSDLVKGVQELWRVAGGKGSGTWYDLKDPDRNGKLVGLLSSMFEQVGVRQPPSARTLRRAIEFANNQ